MNRAEFLGGNETRRDMVKPHKVGDPSRMSVGRAKKGGILIIVENLPVPFDRRVWQEAKALKQAGYSVSVICPKGRGYDKSEEVIDDIHIYRHPLPVDASGALGYLAEYSAALFWEFMLSFKVLRRQGFDVIHACNPPDLIFLVAAFHKIFFKKKFMFDQHDINPELYELKFGKRGFFHSLLCLFERWTFSWADASIATNETFKEIAIARGGMNPPDVWVVKSYPDLKRFKRIEPDHTLKQRFSHLVGYVGIMASQDGVDILVRAIAHVIHDLGRRDIGCVIIGDGPEYEALTQLAKELNVEENVIFTGFLTGDDLLRKMSALDIGVIPDPPSACNDKLSMNKVFEYMALGLPFVQFSLSQANLEAGEAAHIVEGDTPDSLGDGIVHLLADEAGRKRMSAYGMERASREFQWEGESEKLLDAYQALFRR